MNIIVEGSDLCQNLIGIDFSSWLKYNHYDVEVKIHTHMKQLLAVKDCMVLLFVVVLLVAHRGQTMWFTHTHTKRQSYHQ